MKQAPPLFEDVPMFDVPDTLTAPNTYVVHEAPGAHRPGNTYVVKCPRGQHRVGVIDHGGHLIYRMHGIHTMTGLFLTCSASLQTIHQLPPPTRPDIDCLCQIGDHP